jgi:asparagine synthase (glutamine-hydrolysing)
VAGWLLAWSRDDAPPDPNRWRQSVVSAVRYGGSVAEHRSERILLGAWRRNGGEFPLSGRILSVSGTQAAWVGQCVKDAGDATEEAVTRVAANPFDGAGVAMLNGPFAAAIVRARPFEVRVLTDRHRHYPVYIYSSREAVVASTEIRCLVPWLKRPALDHDAVDMLLRCGELIDRQTLLQGVEMLPSGTVLIDAGSAATERRYWSMRSDGRGSLASNAEALGQKLRVGVRRLEAVTPRLGITLSGGLDSRIILDLCQRPDRVPSFTWGLPGCRDIACASAFAPLVNSPHAVRHWIPEAFPPLWTRGVDLTGGSFGIESMFMLPFVSLLASSCDVVFNGLAGDVILGGNWLKHSWLDETDIQRLGRAVWRWRVPEQHDRLVDRLTRRSPGPSSAGERWVESIAAREGARPIERVNDWLLENRIFRTTNCGTMLLRGGIESHAPFFDRDFIDALSGVKQEQKFKHRLYLAVMNRVAPRAASVRWQRTNVSPARGFHANLAAMALQRLATRAGKPFGIQPFADLQVADPAAWVRGAWRKAVEDALFGPRFLARGLVDPDVVREIWNAHLDGSDHSRQLSGLVAIELFAQLMVDGDTT